MSADRMLVWQSLFRRALDILDSAAKDGMPGDDWSFGGGTVLMLKHKHRFSKDIDIFVPEPQYPGYLNPRLNDVAERGMTDYVDQFESIKIYYPEGEDDFVAASALTNSPFVLQEILGRTVKVETPLETLPEQRDDAGLGAFFDFADGSHAPPPSG